MSADVEAFLAQLDHPHASRVASLRAGMLGLADDVTESIKWNAPNFLVGGQDRATFRLAPRDAFQLILHRGASATGDPRPVVDDPTERLVWKGDDRAILDLAGIDDAAVLALVGSWFDATRP